MANPMIPTVHMNGTSYDDLLGQVKTAHEALGAALKALRDMSPNGRDYYVQSPEAVSVAISQHRTRLNSITDIRSDLEKIMIGIVDQER